MRGMDRIMLNCDQATLLATKDSVDKIGCVKRVQLQMHLMGCKFCRTFVKQSEQISEQLNKEKQIDPNEYKLHLTVVQKEMLQTSIKKNIK